MKEDGKTNRREQGDGALQQCGGLREDKESRKRLTESRKYEAVWGEWRQGGTRYKTGWGDAWQTETGWGVVVKVRQDRMNKGGARRSRTGWDGEGQDRT